MASRIMVPASGGKVRPLNFGALGSKTACLVSVISLVRAALHWKAMLLPKPSAWISGPRNDRTAHTLSSLSARAAFCLLALAAGCSSSPGSAVTPSDDGGVAHSGTPSTTPASQGGSGAQPVEDGAVTPVEGDSAAPTEGDATTQQPMTTPDGSVDTSPEGEGGAPVVVTCPSTALKPGDTNGSVAVGGLMRNYILHVPTGYTGQMPVPLVVDYHPILENDAYERQASGYAAKADTEGFVVVFPDGMPSTGTGGPGSSTSNAWNIGPCCTPSRTVDDLGFSRALVKKMQAQACIDPKRIYAVGYSMGGGMTHYLGCNMADVFAAISPAAFDLLEASEEPCNPVRPITEITFRGTADPIVPYAGGASMPPNGLPITIHFLGAVGTFQKWSQLDGCTGSPSASDSNGCQTYSQCKAGVEVTLCTTQGGGHVTGNPAIAWPMLKKHPMP